MKKLTVFISLVLIAFSSIYAKDKVVIEGSTTVLPIAQICAEEYMNINPEADITVRGGGSGVGLASLVEGMCDIANASRAIKDKELKKAIANNIYPKANVIAMDGIAVIVNNSNALKAISKKDLKKVYTGKISDWSELGLPKGKIVVISRDTASGTYEAFNKLALDKAKVRPDALLQASNQAVVSVVSKTPGAIGYAGLGYLSSKISAVIVEGIECSKKTVLSGEYPLSRPLFMYTNGKPKGLIKEFIDFVSSEEGQSLVEEEGYVGLK